MNSAEIVVGIFCTDTTKRIALVRTTKEPHKLTIPGGKANLFEKLIDAAKRELKEETGTHAQNLSLVGWGEFITKNKHQLQFDFKCTTSHPQSTPENPNEIIEVVWIPIELAKRSTDLSSKLREEINAYY